MKCCRCEGDFFIKVQGQLFCKTCFCDLFQKRVKKTLSKDSLLQKEDRIAIIQDGSTESLLAAMLLPDILHGLPVKITLVKKKYALGDRVAGSFDKVIIPWNADLEAVGFMRAVMSNSKNRFKGHFTVGKKRYIKLFIHCLASEIDGYAKARKVKVVKRRSDALSRMLESLGTEYPEIAFSILHSMDSLAADKQDI